MVGVAGAPVLRELAGGASEDVGSEVADGNPRQDEEAGVVDDQVEPGALLLGRPADEAIAGGGLPGSGAEAEGAEETAAATIDEVTDLGPVLRVTLLTQAASCN